MLALISSSFGRVPFKIHTVILRCHHQLNNHCTGDDLTRYHPRSVLSGKGSRIQPAQLRAVLESEYRNFMFWDFKQQPCAGVGVRHRV